MVLVFAMARLLLPDQPEQFSGENFDFQTYTYLDAFSMSWMWCVGISQLVTLIELTLKTCSISTFLARMQQNQNRSRANHTDNLQADEELLVYEHND